MRTFAWIAVLCLLTSSGCGSRVDPEKLIDGTANPSNPPEFVTLANGLYAPLYPTNYDWQADEQVRNAYAELWLRDGDDLWPHLVAHADDPRYAFTRGGHDTGLDNLTVGILCQRIAVQDLTYPSFRFVLLSGQEFPALRDRLRALEKQLHAAAPAYKDFKEWARSRAHTPLYELQIEVGHWAIEEVKRKSGLDDAFKAHFEAKVNETIRQLASTKRAIVLGKQPQLERMDYMFFDAAKAIEIRETYLKEQAKDRQEERNKVK